MAQISTGLTAQEVDAILHFHLASAIYGRICLRRGAEKSRYYRQMNDFVYLFVRGSRIIGQDLTNESVKVTGITENAGGIKIKINK